MINVLGTKDLPRLRIGIRPPGGENLETTEYVLSKSPPEEKEILMRVCDLAADAAEEVVCDGLEATMNKFNSMTVE